jgi:hypothetical protein
MGWYSALLLVAAAHETGLLETLETALSSCASQDISRLAHLTSSSRLSLLSTLLFLGVVDVQQTWDLRSYTDDTLGLLTGRSRAYGYFSTERFLTDVARSNGAEPLWPGGQRVCGNPKPSLMPTNRRSFTLMGTASRSTQIR